MARDKSKGPGGRPTKYDEKLLERCHKYIRDYESNGDIIPSIVGLASFISISSSTIHKWRDEKPAFSEMLAILLDKQQQVLLSNGLNGEFNSTITKLVLTKHGYSDKQSVDHSVEGISFNLNYGDEDK